MKTSKITALLIILSMLIRIPFVFLNKMVAGSFDYGKIR